LSLIAALAFALALGGSAARAAGQQKRVLLFSHSTGYRHASIEPGIAAIRALGAREKLVIVPSEDPNVFTAAGLKGFDAIVLLSTDPASIGEADVNPNPVSWAHEFEGGRVFYTAMGHTAESYADKDFLNHLAGGLAWVMKK